jgi:soluble lytic murein transglycosylase-like protein/TolA-binding protein
MRRKVQRGLRVLWRLVPALILLIGCSASGHPVDRPAKEPARVPAAPIQAGSVDGEALFQKAGHYYAQGHYDEALDLIERVDFDQLSPSTRSLAFFLAGLTSHRLGYFDRVEKYLADPDRLPASVKTPSLFFRGEALYWAGRYDEARAVLAQYTSQDRLGPFAAEADRIRGLCLFHQGRPGEALTHFQNLARTRKDGVPHLEIARIHESQRRWEAARNSYLSAMNESRIRAVRAEAAHEYARLLSPVVDQPGREPEKLELVRFLRREWRLAEGLVVIDRLEKAGGPAAFMAELTAEKARFLFYSGQVARSMNYLGESNNLYIRGLERLGAWDRVLKKRLDEAQKAPGDARIRLEAAKVLLRMDQPGRALQVWNELPEATRKGKLQDDWLWHLGFYQYGKSQFKESAETFKKLVETCPGSPNFPAAHYWVGRSLERDRRAKEADPWYRKLCGAKGDDYYRMLAERRLGWINPVDHWQDLPIFEHFLTAEVPGLDASFLPLAHHGAEAVGRSQWAWGVAGLGDLTTERTRTARMDAGSGLTPALAQTAQRIRDLAETGALDLAHLEAERYREQAKTAKAGGAQAQAVHLRSLGLSAAYLAEVEEYREFTSLGYRYFRTLAGESDEKERMLVERRMYPLAYPLPVGRAAREFHLHPALILAIMRIESNYQPDILSDANARGLMQILPSTGQRIAQKMNLPDPLPDTLFDPAANVRYGSWYLAALTREFDGQYPLAIASYNAGPFYVKSWVQQNPGASLEEFIEAIPLDQTRHYVKKVLAAMYRYRRLYGGKAMGPDLTAQIRPPSRNDVDF